MILVVSWLSKASISSPLHGLDLVKLEIDSSLQLY